MEAQALHPPPEKHAGPTRDLAKRFGQTFVSIPSKGVSALTSREFEYQVAEFNSIS